MCGFTGFYALNAARSAAEHDHIGRTMADTLTHRGPDSSGVWRDEDKGLVLAHRRLAIIDISDDGAQPMHSASGRYVLTYNGEIYNYRNLRKDLENAGSVFQGQSDTEVILAGIEAWGFEKTLNALNGMFAFALWDRKEQRLFFARDRMGKKPLYIGWAGKALVFGSELKALRAHPDFKAEMDQRALSGFLRVGYVEAPHCIYKNVWHLPPAQCLSLDVGALTAGENILEQARVYWDAGGIVAAGHEDQNDKSDGETVAEFEDLLSTCVSDRMVSDVPLGAFLSGGIDSSSVVALMAAQSEQAIKTYSIGFENAGFNEAPHAAAIAQHLGTDHHEHICAAQDALDVIPALPDMYDEPFADISAIPTYLVSKFARCDVTVALSGDGGDEMLGGYSRHVTGPKIWRAMGMCPRFIRALISNGIQSLPVSALNALRPDHPQFGYKAHKAARVFACASQEEIYQRLLAKWPTPPLRDAGLQNSALPLIDADLPFGESMMFWDSQGYLPHDILTKVDRASMAVSLEARAPLLDYRIFEYVWRLPARFKIRDGSGKWVLRQVLKKHVPDALFDRPKQGFAMPVGDWLRGNLRDWAEGLLDAQSMEADGLLDAPRIAQMWDAHLGGHGAHDDALWTVLMFQAWKARWM